MSVATPPKSLWYAFVANAALALAKLAAALYTGSATMQAQAAQAFTTAAHQALLLVGLGSSTFSARPDDAHGFARDVYFASFIAAVMLFSVSGVFAMYEGVHKLSEPEAVQAPWLAIVVLVAGLLAQLVALWASIRTANHHRGAGAWLTWLRRTRRRELLVLTAESLLALTGLSLAIICVSLAAITDNPLFDAVGSIISGILLWLMAGFVGWQIKHLLTGFSVDPALRGRIEAQLQSKATVLALHSVMTVAQEDGVLVAIKLQLASASAQDQMKDLQQIEADLRANFAPIQWLYVVPDPCPVADDNAPPP